MWVTCRRDGAWGGALAGCQSRLTHLRVCVLCAIRAQVRQQVGERVAAGDIDAALALTQQLAPGLLAANPHMHFRLLCQKFAELVSGGGGCGEERLCAVGLAGSMRCSLLCSHGRCVFVLLPS